MFVIKPIMASSLLAALAVCMGSALPLTHFFKGRPELGKFQQGLPNVNLELIDLIGINIGIP